MLAADVQDAVFFVENSQQSGEDIIYFTNYKSFKRAARNEWKVDQLILINCKIINFPPVRAYEKPRRRNSWHKNKNEFNGFVWFSDKKFRI